MGDMRGGCFFCGLRCGHCRKNNVGLGLLRETQEIFWGSMEPEKLYDETQQPIWQSY
jgi:hypothetical protein